MLLTILIIVAVLLLIGAVPAYGRYGYSGSGLLVGLVVVIVLLYVLGVIH
jgi:hypothetical protein